MTERPILFSAPMVRAILAGTKMQTRRVINPQPIVQPDWTGPHVNDFGVWFWMAYPDRPGYRFATQDRLPRLNGHDNRTGDFLRRGDRLWVRETFWHVVHTSQEMIGFADGTVKLRAGSAVLTTPPSEGHTGYGEAWKHRPSIFLPRWASRITLEITDVRVQRVQEISEEDARAEGAEPQSLGGVEKGLEAAFNLEHQPYRSGFANLWNKINQERGFGWDVNPWCWCISFRRCV